MWEREHGLTLDSVHNRDGTWHRDPAHLDIESAVFTLQLREQKCFSCESFHVTKE